MTTTKIFIE